MERFTTAVQMALTNKNWYAALSLALSLPDICGKLDNPSMKSQARYTTWVQEWLVPLYTSEIGAPGTQHVFLSAEDCYALRCSYIHAGSDDISNERIRKALNDFHFLAPAQGSLIHRNQSNHTLQLQVDIFCSDVVTAVESWLEHQPADFPNRTAGLLTVWPHPLTADGSFYL